MADLPMTARRQVRLAALTALQKAKLGVEIESPGDWSTPPEALPAILLRSIGDRKDSVNKGQPEFTTAITIEIEARLESKTPSDAQDDIEELCFRIEQALLTNHDLIVIIQQVISVDTAVQISANGRGHQAEAKMLFAFEVFEAFDPFGPLSLGEPPQLESMEVHVDAVDVADLTGTYPDAAFPDAVNPAPRISGPDGRDEGALQINFPP